MAARILRKIRDTEGGRPRSKSSKVRTRLALYRSHTCFGSPYRISLRIGRNKDGETRIYIITVCARGGYLSSITGLITWQCKNTRLSAYALQDISEQRGSYERPNGKIVEFFLFSIKILSRLSIYIYI